MDEDLYETDFYTWTQRQAEHLRAGRLAAADNIGTLEAEIDKAAAASAGPAVPAAR